MFKVHVNDGETPIPEDDICYIVAKEGIFLKKKMGIMESIAPVKNISILESVNSTARMNIKKIPGGQFAQIVAFFKEVYNKFHGESIVLLFYDEERKVYKIIPPKQKVTAAACEYDKGIVIEGMQMIGTIHSHASMSAFHSGTDDNDEEHFDGLHITIGNVNQEDVSITASIVANGHRFVVQPEEYVERLVLTVDIDKTETKPTRKIFRYINGKLVEDVEAASKYTHSYRTFDKRYQVNVSDKYHKVPKGWMDMVEKGVYVFKGYSGYTKNNQGLAGAGWGGNYDASLWKQVRKPHVQGNTILPIPATTTPITFPEHEIEIEGDDTFAPCQTCVFRAYKFLMEEDELDEPDVYVCKKCNEVIVDDTDSEVLPECPNCKSDEYLVQVEDDTLPSRYIEDKN